MASFRGTDLNVSAMGRIDASHSVEDNTCQLTYVPNHTPDKTAVLKLTKAEVFELAEQMQEVTRLIEIAAPDTEIIPVERKADGDTTDPQMDALTDPLPEGGFSRTGMADVKDVAIPGVAATVDKAGFSNLGQDAPATEEEKK